MSTPLSGADPHIAPELARSALLVIDTQVDFLGRRPRSLAGTSVA